MLDEYSRLKAQYRETRITEFFDVWNAGAFSETGPPITFEKSDVLHREMADFCAASGIDLKDLNQFLAEVDQEISAMLPT